jgi:uncharacterized membrane protein
VFKIVLIFHILAGSTALLSGSAALYFRKGSSAHARAGTVFFAAMLAMAASGLGMATFEGERETAAVAVLTAYLVLTSWWTARHRDGKAGWFERCAIVAPAVLSVLLLNFAFDAVAHPRPEVPPQGLFVFAGLAALPALLDLNFIVRGRLSGAQRLTRHLWRMCTAMLFAAFSFFQGQAHVFPEAVQKSFILFVPTLAVFAITLYWIARIRLFKKLNVLLRPSRVAVERP